MLTPRVAVLLAVLVAVVTGIAATTGFLVGRHAPSRKMASGSPQAEDTATAEKTFQAAGNCSGRVYVTVLEQECPPLKFEGNPFLFLNHLHLLEAKIMPPPTTDLPMGAPGTKGVWGLGEERPKEVKALPAKKTGVAIEASRKTFREVIDIFAQASNCTWSAIVYPDGQIQVTLFPPEKDGPKHSGP